jgi:hypothetical protein
MTNRWNNDKKDEEDEEDEKDRKMKNDEEMKTWHISTYESKYFKKIGQGEKTSKRWKIGLK